MSTPTTPEPTPAPTPTPPTPAPTPKPPTPAPFDPTKYEKCLPDEIDKK